jgi:soluble lytic murein transglycosylase-like protein
VKPLGQVINDMKTLAVILFSTGLLFFHGTASAADVVGECRELVDFLNDVVGAQEEVKPTPKAASIVKPQTKQVALRRGAKRPYEDFIHSAASAHGIDPDLIHAIVQEESGYDPQAVGAAGERGLMQLMPGTAQLVGCHRPFSPQDNLWGGTKYLTSLLREFRGNLRQAVAAYNCGPERVRNSQIPASTQGYVRRVIARYEMAQKLH